jgi:hypothetical protein
VDFGLVDGLQTSGLRQGGGVHSAGGVFGRLGFGNGVRLGSQLAWSYTVSDNYYTQLCTL